MAMMYSPEDEIVAYYLKMLFDDRNTWPSEIFHQSKHVYRTNPWNHFKTDQEEEPLIVHDGRYFFVEREDTSCGKTDGCESGCWRTIGRDKVIRSEKKQKILGFKRIRKFVEKEKEPRSVFRFVEREKRRVKDKRVWVMEEYRLASKWKQCYVICKIRLLNPNPLEFLLSNHVRCYYR